MPDERSQEQLYSIQLMQALDLELWDDTAADRMLNDIIERVQSTPIFRYILSLAKANKQILDMTKLFSEPLAKLDSSIVFRLLFSYDYFDMMHRCVSDVLREGTVKEDHYVALCNALCHDNDALCDHRLTFATFSAALD